MASKPRPCPALPRAMHRTRDGTEEVVAESILLSVRPATAPYMGLNTTPATEPTHAL